MLKTKFTKEEKINLEYIEGKLRQLRELEEHHLQSFRRISREIGRLEKEWFELRGHE